MAGTATAAAEAESGQAWQAMRLLETALILFALGPRLVLAFFVEGCSEAFAIEGLGCDGGTQCGFLGS